MQVKLHGLVFALNRKQVCRLMQHLQGCIANKKNKKNIAVDVGITWIEKQPSVRVVLAPFPISINPIEFLAGVDN